MPLDGVAASSERYDLIQVPLLDSFAAAAGGTHSLSESYLYTVEALAAYLDHLRPGGYLLHKIDLRDYGMFTKYGYHPLEFLTVPDFVYRQMVESAGQPNRYLVDYYRRKT